MEPRIRSWGEAKQRLNAVRETCEAVSRGDQPEKLESITQQDLLRIHAELSLIFTFCEQQERFHASSYDGRSAELHRQARMYLGVLSCHLLTRDDVSQDDKKILVLTRDIVGVSKQREVRILVGSFETEEPSWRARRR